MTASFSGREEKNSRCDSAEVNCQPPFSLDTNIVTRDTLIAGNTYYKVEGQHLFWKEPRFFRDSGDYIVNSHGEIIFTNIHSDQTYNYNYVVDKSDTLFYWYYQLADDTENIAVKAGTYPCLDFRGSFFRRADEFNVEHNMHNLYSKDVGLVKETVFFASNVQVTKRELVGYHIQPKSSVIP